MAKESEEARSWQDQDAAAKQAMEEMRRSLQRVHEQIRTFREVMAPEPEPQDETPSGV